MKILVLGSTGMAGHMVEKYLKLKGYDVTTVARKNADLSINVDSTDSVITFCDSLTEKYDFVVNCIGALVKFSNDDPAKAILINSWFPHYLEKHFKNTKTKIIQLSTDCIFDGKEGNYNETDTPTETNMYGRSKLLGEIVNDKDITFRMSIIGPELKNGIGLLNWVLTNENDELPGWNNAWWNGITTLQLARCIEQYIQNPKISGLFQLTNTHSSESKHRINKYELLCLMNTVFELNKTVVETQGPKDIDKVLINNRMDDFKFDIDESYEKALIELKEFYFVK